MMNKPNESKKPVTSKYFKEEEFKKCNPPCSLQDMDQDFMDWLDSVREDAGISFRLKSAFRSKQHEQNMGRSGNSAHTEGKAVDIDSPNSVSRFKILKSAFAKGCKRLGIDFSKNFIHLDRSTKLDHEVVWKY
ncbi:MAG: D-Ala-D-Ala carboxypeptidase family metallohydrolase [Bacteroidetes bacterium]|nr:D-Ala-D-Ala carboxypeptidase family metallohydrolase [Bacteroidota bacterium]MCL2302901.1 D-Ala-D-Ala carboxypeptidase family metallohydrolase [Lentimicrobiaceae bacterium]